VRGYVRHCLAPWGGRGGGGVLPRPSVAAADEAGRGLVDRHTTAPHASSSACTADGGRHTAHCCKPYRRPASARRVRLLATVPPIEGLAVQVYRPVRIHCSCCTTAVRVLLFASVGSWPQLYVLTAEPAGRGGSMHSCIYATRIFPQIGVGSGSRLLALLAVGQEYLHPADAILLGPLQYLFIRNY
jgi:hypothetical protein